jgi:peptide deformylase
MGIDLPTLSILHYPAEALRRRARPVQDFDEELRAVAGRMIQLMFEAEGVGLAAPQVGLDWRLFVAHVPEQDGRSAAATPPTASRAPRIFVNPRVVEAQGAPEPLEEGCLSLPDIRGDVLRTPAVVVEALDEHGRAFRERAAGLLSRCWQHEIDHLDGILIIDRMTQVSRLRTRIAVRALEQQARARQA